MSEKLFIAYLGGKMSQERIGEDHETVVLVALDREDAKKKARAKWKGEGAAHLDMLVEVETVDGYKVFLEKTVENQKLIKDDDWAELNPGL